MLTQEEKSQALSLCLHPPYKFGVWEMMFSDYQFKPGLSFTPPPSKTSCSESNDFKCFRPSIKDILKDSHRRDMRWIFRLKRKTTFMYDFELSTNPLKKSITFSQAEYQQNKSTITGINTPEVKQRRQGCSCLIRKCKATFCLILEKSGSCEVDNTYFLKSRLLSTHTRDEYETDAGGCTAPTASWG